ncbi:hypothetical protein CC79DRAFT_1327383 [Sarocladium strictum]
MLLVHDLNRATASFGSTPEGGINRQTRRVFNRRPSLPPTHLLHDHLLQLRYATISLEVFEISDRMRGKVLYRVESGNSQARTTWDRGAQAADLSLRIISFRLYGYAGMRLRKELALHLRWSNRRKTVFISLYSSRWAAEREADRRLANGTEDVRIITFWIIEEHGVLYRHVPTLADMLGYRIPRRAEHNAEYEYIALHSIPPSAIVDIDEM